MLVLDTIHAAKARRQRQFALLIDPDDTGGDDLARIARRAQAAKVDLLFVGGSLLVNDTLADCVRTIKNNCGIPVVLFPGDNLQVTKDADAILLLSVISGRNPEMLIGKHVVAAPRLRHSGLEVMPTGYMLIDSGRPTTASYMSNSQPIPRDKEDIAVCTAMAGEMLGMRLIFMDGGSGAEHAVTDAMIAAVASSISIPLIIGGGIRTPEMARAKFEAGADIVVVGNAIEKESALLEEMVYAAHS